MADANVSSLHLVLRKEQLLVRAISLEAKNPFWRENLKCDNDAKILLIGNSKFLVLDYHDI